MNKIGFGFLRFQKTGNDYDWSAIREMTDLFLDSGGRYFDTCYTYLNGASEEAIRRCVVNGRSRSDVQICDKLPGYLCRRPADALKYFEEMRRRCSADYFDVLMLHWLNAKNYEIADRLGQFEFLEEQKKAGNAVRIGFSYHDSAELLDRILTEHPNVDVVQIQLNYLDWKLQDAKGKTEVIAGHGLKVIVMEGVRGGRLARLPEAQEARLRALRKEDSPVRWALRWLQSLPEVAVVLSGMSSLEQIVENVETFDHPDPTGEEEKALLAEVADSMLSWVPCTACRYCTEGCPMNLEIPRIITAYNGMKNGDFMSRYDPDKAGEAMDPRRCVGCGACAAICPQGISIPDIMSEMAEMLKPPRR